MTGRRQTVGKYVISLAYSCVKGFFCRTNKLYTVILSFCKFIKQSYHLNFTMNYTVCVANIDFI